MDRAAYDRFTRAVTDWAVADRRIVGLVALGSMADVHRAPDEWSDHDFWLVTRNGCAPEVREERDRLPDAERIVVFFAETEHGRSAIYDDGHLVEYAVFDDSELEIARANVFRVLHDQCGLAARMEAMAERTTAEALGDPTGDVRLGKFLAQLVIGVTRLRRGEVLSASSLIRGWAPGALLSLLATFVDSEADGVLDNLDPHRRFETAYPALGARIAAALERPALDTAAELLAVARSELSGAVPGATPEAFDAVAVLIDRAGIDRAGR